MDNLVMDKRLSTAILASIPEPFFVFDEQGRYIEILGGADRDKYHEGRHLIGKYIHDVIEKDLADAFVSQIRSAIQQERVTTYVYQLAAGDIQGSAKLPGPEGKLWFEAHISPVDRIEGRTRMVVWVAFNITESRKILLEKEALIESLNKAFREIKTLKGILPICSHCKMIRDESGSWKQLEAYLHEHSDADLSHGICPDCYKKHYSHYIKK
ncbi:MAG: PAS domain-containing protein [Desulfopila sp.]|jgi:hypothetical protein|nr:PAS domain-containing protein [Desulfopila sp.]